MWNKGFAVYDYEFPKWTTSIKWGRLAKQIIPIFLIYIYRIDSSVGFFARQR